MGETTIQKVKDDCLSVFYGGKKITINISKELAIDENIINSQLKQHPSNYAFLCLLRDKAIRNRDKLEKRKDTVYAEIWLFYRATVSNNDSASYKVLTNKRYRAAEKAHLKASDLATRLISVCKAYESRERILQTVSANKRKEQ